MCSSMCRRWSGCLWRRRLTIAGTVCQGFRGYREIMVQSFNHTIICSTIGSYEFRFRFFSLRFFSLARKYFSTSGNVEISSAIDNIKRLVKIIPTAIKNTLVTLSPLLESRSEKHISPSASNSAISGVLSQKRQL